MSELRAILTQSDIYLLWLLAHVLNLANVMFEAEG